MTIDLKHIQDRCREDGDCWIWRMAITSNGTPTIHVGDRLIGTRRVVAGLMGLNIDGKVVTTTCGDSRCVCPDHILVATKRRMAELIVERTGHPYRLERRKKISDSARARIGKLTPELAQEIRESSETLKVISERMGVAKGTAQRVRAGQAWKDYSSPFAGLGARA